MRTIRMSLALAACLGVIHAQAASTPRLRPPVAKPAASPVDRTAPLVTRFAVPATASSLSIPIASLAATDNVGVMAYFVSETATPPAATATGWTPAAPASYKASSAGSKTLYAWAKDKAGNVSAGKVATCTVTLPPPPPTPASPPGPGDFNLAQTLSDGAQLTTLAFDGLAMVTGNLNAQSFFPPGKVADYTGFQSLRDNDPDGMGHNTSFLTRAAHNVLYLLTDEQLAQLKALAARQVSQINQYGYQRFPLMLAFRRTLDGNLPAGSSGLSLDAVKRASRKLYLIDGQISFDRAVLYADIIHSLTTAQRSYLLSMRGTGFNGWPDIADEQVKSKLAGLAPGVAVAVMTYAGDLFSWFTGSLDDDVYFCPERHGTYFGSFYMKDAPAVGHEGYGISTSLTATAGSALVDPAQGYVTASQAAVIARLLDLQEANLDGIVAARTQIATLLRSLIATPSAAAAVLPKVLALSASYGELDGENNYHYTKAFAQVRSSLTSAQLSKLMALRTSILSGSYADGTPFNFSTASAPYLYAAPITDQSLLAPYLAAARNLFQ